jgi:hypothetical protein
MKLRFAVLVLAALLPAAGIAGASTSPTFPAASPDGQAVSSHGPAPISFGQAADCGGFSRSTPAIAGLTPAPSPLGPYNTCGSCSTAVCRGATTGQLCGYSGGQPGRCDSPWGNNCSDGITWQCQCWYGPLP